MLFNKLHTVVVGELQIRNAALVQLRQFPGSQNDLLDEVLGLKSERIVVNVVHRDDRMIFVTKC